jgi:hypothetical protein
MLLENIGDCGTKPIGKWLSGRTILMGALWGMLSVFGRRDFPFTASAITSSRDRLGMDRDGCSGVKRIGSTTVLVPDEGEAD